MRRGLQFALRALGGVAVVAGARGVLRGAEEVPERGVVSPNVDSEYRFYAAWYPVFGVLLLRAAQAPERESALIRACGAGSLLAATGRLLSIRNNGVPHPSQRVLLGIELLIPAVIVPWQARVKAAGRAG